MHNSHRKKCQRISSLGTVINLLHTTPLKTNMDYKNNSPPLISQNNVWRGGFSEGTKQTSIEHSDGIFAQPILILLVSDMQRKVPSGV